jgi:aldose 1-epimerase
VDLVTLSAGDLQATFAPEAGMVGSSLRHQGGELLGQRGGLDAYVRRGSTFGIPLLHPWANRLASFEYEIAGTRVKLDPAWPQVRTDEHGLPIHGLCSACPYWQVVSSDASSLVARLPFGDHEDLLRGFPFPHDLEMAVSVEPEALHVTTTLRPTGDTPVPVSFGYHPYLTLPGVARSEFDVALPVRARGALDDHAIPTGESEPVDIPPAPLGDRTFDDFFPELAEPPDFGLAGGGRRITVHYDEGYPVAQVYAPAAQPFICYEPMTAPTNALVEQARLPLVDPGDHYQARFTVTVRTAL